MMGVLELEQHRSWCQLVKLWAYVDARSPDTCSEWLVPLFGVEKCVAFAWIAHDVVDFYGEMENRYQRLHF